MKIHPPTSALENAIYILQPWPNYLNGKPHTGIDIYSQKYKRHVPLATEDGKIKEIFPGTGNKVGRVVVEGEATGTDIFYKHVATTLKKGASVKAGDILGNFDESGKDSGWWQGYHLHFEVHPLNDGKENDPVLYLLGLMPDIIFYMRDNVFAIYKEKEYFSQMNIQPKPF